MIKNKKDSSKHSGIFFCEKCMFSLVCTSYCIDIIDEQRVSSSSERGHVFEPRIIFGSNWFFLIQTFLIKER